MDLLCAVLQFESRIIPFKWDEAREKISR